jgi:hypothetical protein
MIWVRGPVHNSLTSGWNRLGREVSVFYRLSTEGYAQDGKFR